VHRHQRRALVARAPRRRLGPPPRPGPAPALRRLADPLASEAGL